MRKCANISPYIRRRPSVIYDFAAAPFWISLESPAFLRLNILCFCSPWVMQLTNAIRGRYSSVGIDSDIWGQGTTTRIETSVLFRIFLVFLSPEGCCLSVVGYRLLAVGCWLSVVGYRLLAVGCWLSVVGCRLFAIGCWLSVVGCRLWVIGFICGCLCQVLLFVLLDRCHGCQVLSVY